MTAYGYDSLDRVSGGHWTYGYDQLGNLINKEGATQTYFSSGASSVHPHALCSVGGTSCTTGTTYAYDANGNLTLRSDGLADHLERRQHADPD